MTKEYRSAQNNLGSYQTRFDARRAGRVDSLHLFPLRKRSQSTNQCEKRSPMGGLVDAAGEPWGKQ